MLGPRLLTVADVEALADVPPREQLFAMLAGGFQAPLTKAAGLFQAFTRNFAYGLKAYIDQHVEGGEAEPPDVTAADASAGAPTEADASADVSTETETSEHAQEAGEGDDTGGERSVESTE